MAGISTAPKKNSKDVILPYQKSGEYHIEDLGEVKLNPLYAFVKRTFDIGFSLISLIILAIPMLVIALFIKINSKGPVLYKQERQGKNNKTFIMLKFRTMHVDAEKDGARWSADVDDRATSVGAFLRKTKLDELPQLINILKNDMSFIGPRPERDCFIQEFETYIIGFSERMKVKPGLTGYAQVYGGYYLKPEEKIVYDIEYIKNMSLKMDMKIIAKSFAVVLFQKGQKEN